MNYSKAIFLALLLASVSACFKAPTGNPSQSPPDVSSSNRSTTSNSADTQSTSSTGDYSKALEAYKAKKYDEAATGFELVAKSDPKNFDANFYLGKSYEGLEKDDDAVRAYKAAIAIKPEHGEANLNAGLIEHNRRNYPAAAPFLEQAVKTDFKSPKALMALGDNQRMMKMYDRAIVQYGKVIGFEPNNAEAYYGLGLTYIGLNNKIGARQQLRKLEPLNAELAKKLSDQIGS
jgi:tetratricopeptide (TPR) repeat protein